MSSGRSGDRDYDADLIVGESPDGGQPHVYSLSPDLTALLPHQPATTGSTDSSSMPGTRPTQIAQWGAPPSPDDRDGCDLLLDAAARVGVGLVGPGGAAAARAILARMLTATPGAALRLTVAAHGKLLDRGTNSPVSGLTPASIAPADRRSVGKRSISAVLSGPQVHLACSLPELLDAVEADLLTRTRLIENTVGRAPVEPLLLIVTAPRQTERLRSAIDLGAMLGIGLVVLGAWPTGLTCLVDQDGSVRRAVGADTQQWSSALNKHLVFTNSSADLQAIRDFLDHATTAASADLDPALAAPTPGTSGATSATRPATSAPETSSDVRCVSPIRDTAADVIATVEPSAGTDTQLEIIAPRLAPARSTRPRLGQASWQPADYTTPTPTSITRDESSTPEETAQPVTAHANGDDDTARALIMISMLGALRVQWHPEANQEQEITGALQPRTKELLVLLALHPGGTTRDTLVSMLWGQASPARPTNALHTALARMRRDLTEATGGAVTDIALVDNGHYRLDPAVVHVDYWQFENAMAARRAAATDAERIAAYREVVDSYGGPLADGMSKLEWSEPAREAIRRDAIDAVAALARALHDDDPQQTLDLLEVARAFDPHNELLYRDIMRLQERLGLIDAIPRTLSLLTARLTEVNNRPSEHTIGLATRLRQRHEDNPSARSRPATRAADVSRFAAG